MEIIQPPRDKEGLTLPHDHAQLKPDDRFIRRISDQFLVRSSDGKGRRISSQALEASSSEVDPYQGLSGDLEALIISDGVNPYTHVTTPRFFGSIVFKISSFREKGFLVGYDPIAATTSTPENPYHGAVWGNEEKNIKLTKTLQKRLLKEASWFVQIADCKIYE